jgi:hypothetical protein
MNSAIRTDRTSQFREAVTRAASEFKNRFTRSCDELFEAGVAHRLLAMLSQQVIDLGDLVLK